MLGGRRLILVIKQKIDNLPEGEDEEPTVLSLQETNGSNPIDDKISQVIEAYAPDWEDE